MGTLAPCIGRRRASRNCWKTALMLVQLSPRRYLPARSGSPECLLMIASVMRGVGILGRWLDRCDAIAGGYSSAWLAAWNRGVIDTMRAAPDGITTGA